MKKKRFFKYVIIIASVFMTILAIYCVCTHFVNVFLGIEQAKIEVMHKAREDLGNDCEVVYQKYDYQNKCYQIGCINSSGDSAIMYIATQGIDGKEWLVKKLVSRNGGGAGTLFNTPIIVRES